MNEICDAIILLLELFVLQEKLERIQQFILKGDIELLTQEVMDSRRVWNSHDNVDWLVFGAIRNGKSFDSNSRRHFSVEYGKGKN